MLKKFLNEIKRLDEKQIPYEAISCETINAAAQAMVKTCPIAENEQITSTI